MAGKNSQFETKVIHAGETSDAATGAVMPPIVTSTTFEWEALGQPRDHIYTRSSNPTRDALERCVALGNRIGALKIACRGGQNHVIDAAVVAAS